MSDPTFAQWMTEADSVKDETRTDLPAHKVRALIEILGRDGAIDALLEGEE